MAASTAASGLKYATIESISFLYDPSMRSNVSWPPSDVNFKPPFRAGVSKTVTKLGCSSSFPASSTNVVMSKSGTLAHILLRFCFKADTILSCNS